MRRNAFTLIEAVVIVAIVGILAAVLLPVFQRTHCDDREWSCRSKLKQIGLGFSQYVQDYDGRFPPTSVSKKGNWAGSLQPYIASWQLFKCPSSGGVLLKTTDYFYNARLARIEARKVPVQQTILCGDGLKNSPTNYALPMMPAVWRTSDKLPAKRHSGRADYLFADGHTKPLDVEQVSDFPILEKGQIGTFAR